MQALVGRWFWHRGSPGRLAPRPPTGPPPHALGTHLLAGPVRLGAAAPRARCAPPAVAPATRDRAAPPRPRLRRGSRAGTPATATGRRGTGTPLLHRASLALRPWPALAWEAGGLVPAHTVRAAAPLPCWACPGRGGSTLRAGGSLHAVAERRPASGGAPTRGALPGGGGPSGLGRVLLGFPPRALGGRGRDASYPAPPEQIPACGTTAPGSCLGS